MSSIDDLADLVMDGLREYSELADTAMKKAVRKTAASVRKEISENAPKDTGTYAKSWATKNIRRKSMLSRRQKNQKGRLGTFTLRKMMIGERQSHFQHHLIDFFVTHDNSFVIRDSNKSTPFSSAGAICGLPFTRPPFRLA